MSEITRPPAVTVTRTVVVRVAGPLDSIGVGQLHRILEDLIDGQGVRHLIVDVSQATQDDGELATVVGRASERMEKTGGVMELRAPTNPSAELRDLADEIPTFAPLGHESDHR